MTSSTPIHGKTWKRKPPGLPHFAAQEATTLRRRDGRKAGLLIAAIACLLLSSCSSVIYVSPPGATARLIFSGPAWQASIREGPSCDNTLMVPRESWSGIRVKTGKRLYIEHGIHGLTQGCLLALSFEPKEETSYVSEFRADGAYCGIEIYRFDAQGRRVRDETVRLERVSFPHPCRP